MKTMERLRRTSTAYKMAREILDAFLPLHEPPPRDVVTTMFWATFDYVLERLDREAALAVEDYKATVGPRTT